MKRQLHLNLFIHSRGHHEAAWRHPDASPLPLTDIRYYQDLAQRAESALFDSIFLADQLALGEDVSQAARTWLEPVTVLSAIAVATQRIGMIATCSTTYTEPFNLARQFGSLDHISNGRIGWNIVTSWLATAAANFGSAGQATGQISHADRYARGEEFMAVVKALWDSWADKGKYYQVAGPLNLPRCPQGRPVLVQAGSSDTGRRFAARHAEAVFTAHMEKATAQAFYNDLKALVKTEGREPEHVLILPGLSPMIASTEAEAQRLAREVNELSDPEVGRKRLSGRFGGHDFSHLPLDRPLVPEDFPPPSTVEAARSRTEVILNLVRREKPTLRQLLARRSDRGVVQGRRRRRLQHHAAAAAVDARRVQRGGDPAVAAARAVPHGVRGEDAARALWSRLAEERLPGARAAGRVAALNVPSNVERKSSKRRAQSLYCAFAPQAGLFRPGGRRRRGR